MNEWRGKAAAAVAGAVGIMVLATGTAQAHVQVTAPQAVVGQAAMLDFRVPSEEQVATTIRVRVTVPADVTIIDIPPVAGWIGVMAKDRAGDTVLTWTAQGAGVAPTQATDFLATASALPNRPTVSFATVQTYSNGDMVYWSQAQVGATVPPYPAPVLTLAGATAGATPDIAGITPAAPVVSAAPVPQAPSAAMSAPPAVVPGWVIALGVGGGVVILAGAIALVIVLLRQWRNPTAS